MKTKLFNRRSISMIYEGQHNLDLDTNFNAERNQYNLNIDTATKMPSEFFF